MLFDYDTLQVIWWILVGVLLIGFALTSGMDMAVSTLLFKVGKNSQERGVLINTIAPHWDGNQVWLITAGGAIFAAWPEVYAASFSGLYWGMLLVLFAIWLRPLAFDYRNHYADESWLKRWDIALTVGSLVPLLIFGVVFGNLLQGLPFWADENVRWHYDGVFLSALLPLLDPFSLLCGVISVSMLLTHACFWIQLRTVNAIGDRTKQLSYILALTTVGLYCLAGLWAYFFDGWSLVQDAPADSFNMIKDKVVERVPHGLYANYGKVFILWLVPIFAIASFLGAAFAGYKGWAERGIICTSLGIAFTIMTAAVALFPFVMPSSVDAASSLTIWDATSSHLTLQVMLYAVLIFVPIALGYTIWAYKRMWGKLGVDESAEAKPAETTAAKATESK